MFDNYNNVKRWELWGILWIVLIGSLLHFTYEWSGNSYIVGSFSAVNESVWEHLKLGYFPLLLFSIVEYWFVRNKVRNFYFSKTIGIIAMELFIIISFYFYTAITNKPILFMDIGLFILGAVICQLISFKLMKLNIGKSSNIIWFSLFILIGCIFVLFTFYTPELPLFMDYNTKKYGV
ncbi:hypothetical protein KQI41_02380 [Tissierella pigra]|uniref:DUF6512 family protein n=1 Tax=Tissierella pigra TaxID=2607614 RepID=UPI001C10F4D3|nr:DUF6512 family protein [Tissierella pigra]MBU5425247.1 hypothetical protein [Tissierella pigra]